MTNEEIEQRIAALERQISVLAKLMDRMKDDADRSGMETAAFQTERLLR